MIRKQYKPDGSPDLRRWTVECDSCGLSHELSGTTDWVVHSNFKMPDYCPDCTLTIAAFLIETAFS